MKKLFFLAVLLGTILLTSVFVFSYWRLQTRTPEAYFESGKAEFDKGSLSEAMIEFLRALQLDAGHRDSRYYMALTYLALNDTASAAQQLRLLLEAYPNDVDANLKLGNIYLTAGPLDPAGYKLAEERARAVLPPQVKDENASARILLGNALAGSQEYTESLQELEKAIALEPTNVSAWISLGSAQARQKDFAAAEKSFLKAREVDSKDKSALISLASYYRLVGAPEKAEAVYNSALAQYPADQEIYSEVVTFYVLSRRIDDAERVLRGAQAASASDPTPTIDLSDLYQALGRKDDARKLLLDAKPKFPKNVALAAKIASNLMPDSQDNAKKEIDQILKEDPNNASGKGLLADYQYSSGQFRAAAETLAHESASANPVAQYVLGNLALKDGNTSEAERHFQRSVQLDRRFIPGRIAVLNGMVLQGRLQEARNEVREILALDPTNGSARAIKASLDINDKKYAEAEAGLTELLKDHPDNPAVHQQFAFYYAARGRNADAEKSFLRALELAPNFEQISRDLTQFYLRNGLADRAMQQLNSVPDAQKHAFHYELMGTIVQAQKPQEAEGYFRKAIELEKDSPKRQMSAEIVLLKHYLRNGRYDDALKQLDNLEKKSPSSGVVHAWRGTIRQTQGDLPGAEESYKRALQLDPASDLAGNNLAYLLSHDPSGRDLEMALQLAQDIRKRQPESPDIADTLGWVYYRLGNFSLAQAQAEFAVSKQPTNGEFQYHLGEIYRKTSEKNKAVAALKKAANSPANFSEKKLALEALGEIQKETAGSKR